MGNKDSKSWLPWVLLVVGLIVGGLLVYGVAPREVEVVKEVDKEVLKYVNVSVPVEVIKEVEVDKLIPVSVGGVDYDNEAVVELLKQVDESKGLSLEQIKDEAFKEAWSEKSDIKECDNITFKKSEMDLDKKYDLFELRVYEDADNFDDLEAEAYIKFRVAYDDNDEDEAECKWEAVVEWQEDGDVDVDFDLA